MEGEPLLVQGPAEAIPVEHGAPARFRRLRVRDALPALGRGECGEARELMPATLGNLRAELAAEIAPVQERLGGGPFLSHEEQGQGGRQEQDGRGRAHRLGGSDAR